MSGSAILELPVGVAPGSRRREGYFVSPASGETNGARGE